MILVHLVEIGGQSSNEVEQKPAKDIEEGEAVAEDPNCPKVEKGEAEADDPKVRPYKGEAKAKDPMATSHDEGGFSEGCEPCDVVANGSAEPEGGEQQRQQNGIAQLHD
eukprot:12584191-Prorocentrum_lima.AAC.1